MIAGSASRPARTSAGGGTISSVKTIACLRTQSPCPRAAGLGVEPIIRYGTSPATLPISRQAETRRAVLAFTEVTGGANFDPHDPRVRTFAHRDGDYWVISNEAANRGEGDNAQCAPHNSNTCAYTAIGGGFIRSLRTYRAPGAGGKQPMPSLEFLCLEDR